MILWRFPLNAELITATNADHACGGPACMRYQLEQLAKRCAQQCQHSCIPIALVCFAGMLICGLRLGRGWAACGLILHGAPWCSIYTCALICNAMTLQEGCKCLGASQHGAAMSCWRDLVDLVPNAMSSQLLCKRPCGWQRVCALLLPVKPARAAALMGAFRACTCSVQPWPRSLQCVRIAAHSHK